MAPLNVPASGAIDFLALGALVHRLDSGIVPFDRASPCDIHVSGGEYNCAANLSSCFLMRAAIATAIVDYPIGNLIESRVSAMGVTPFYKRFAHDACADRIWLSSTATADSACGRRSSSITARTRQLRASDQVISTGRRFSGAACAGSMRAASLRRYLNPRPTSFSRRWRRRALLATFPGDTTMATLEEVRALATGGCADIQR